MKSTSVVRAKPRGTLSQLLLVEISSSVPEVVASVSSHIKTMTYISNGQLRVVSGLHERPSFISVGCKIVITKMVSQDRIVLLTMLVYLEFAGMLIELLRCFD